jgi:hypothetical protein
MDDAQFEAFTSELAHAKSRRAALKIFGGALLGVLGIAKGERAAVEAQSAPSGSTILCNQKYALCAAAPCVPSAGDPTMVVCRCPVYDGYSLGYTSCADRMQKGTMLTSNFSMQGIGLTSGPAVMICDAGVGGGVWGNCMDAPCQIDSADPTQAVCQCKSAKSQKYITYGGNCQPGTCTTTIWSSNSLDFSGIDDYIIAMRQAGQPVPDLKICPVTGF